jgi:hypothetical protein
MKTTLLPVTAALGLLVGCTESNVRQASNEFSDLPAAVQKSVRDKAPNAEIADVEERRREGLTTYVIQFRDARLHPEMEVAADGQVVRYEAGTAALGRPGDDDTSIRGSSKYNLSALPVEVQKAISKNAPRAEVVDIRRRENDGRVIYEVEYAGKEPRSVLHVGADGNVVKELHTRSDK